MFDPDIIKTVVTLFLFLFIIYPNAALVYKSKDGVVIRYKITMGQFCGNKAESFNKFVGIPLAECAKECGTRKHCKGLRYHRRYTLCELISGPNVGPQKDGSCIFIPASDIVVEQECSDCTDDYKTCDANTNECEYKECKEVDKDTFLRGNMRNVGNKIMQKCDGGYNYSVCLKDGTWSKNDVCKPLVNIAIGKRASMSSRYNISNMNEYPASLGVDGNMTTFFHTSNESDPWWRVDLGSVFGVILVHVFNRNELSDSSVLRRAITFCLQLGVTINSLKEYDRVDELGLNKTFELPANTFARYVQTQIFTTNFFHLFEVQVMAYPS